MCDAFDDILEPEYDCSHGEVITGDTLSVLPELPENEFHAIVTDPPYNFEDGFMQKEWDNIGTSSEYQQWCQEWAESALTTLKPGGHLIAFGGNRSHHRLMSGVEDAGYEIRDTITWHYGNGFPKGASPDTYRDGIEKNDWRPMLKPATEFAVLARAPLSSGTALDDLEEHGTGYLNVEQCRIGTEMVPSNGWRSEDGGGLWDSSDEAGGMYENTDKELREENEGRFPSNIALDSTMAELMDLQSGDSSGGNAGGSYEHDGGDVYGEQRMGGDVNETSYDDFGGASRFFYCSKASGSERTHDGSVENDHPTVKPIDLMEWLVKMVTAEGQKVLDPFLGSGTTMLAAENVGRECVGIERDKDYVEIAEQRFSEGTE